MTEEKKVTVDTPEFHAVLSTYNIGQMSESDFIAHIDQYAAAVAAKAVDEHQEHMQVLRDRCNELEDALLKAHDVSSPQQHAQAALSDEQIKVAAMTAWPDLPPHWWEKHDGEVRKPVWSFARAILAASQQPAAAPADSRANGGDKQTDLSKRLRMTAERHPSVPSGMAVQAAEEIERYYTGMLNWKATAEAKDRAAAPAMQVQDGELPEWSAAFSSHADADPVIADGGAGRLLACDYFKRGMDYVLASQASKGAVPEGYVLVPKEPTEAMWSGLARDIVMAWRFNNWTPNKMAEFIDNMGHEVPEWLKAEPEMDSADHTISKGTCAVLLYKIMLAAAPSPARPAPARGEHPFPQAWDHAQRIEAATYFLRGYSDANMEKLLGDYEVQPIIRKLAAMIGLWQQTAVDPYLADKCAAQPSPAQGEALSRPVLEEVKQTLSDNDIRKRAQKAGFLDGDAAEWSFTDAGLLEFTRTIAALGGALSYQAPDWCPECHARESMAVSEFEQGRAAGIKEAAETAWQYRADGNLSQEEMRVVAGIRNAILVAITAQQDPT